MPFRREKHSENFKASFLDLINIFFLQIDSNVTYLKLNLFFPEPFDFHRSINYLEKKKSCEQKPC